MGEFESVVREIVREELAAARGVPAAYSLSAKSIGAAVRAECARAGKNRSELAEALGVSRPTIAGRLSGAYEFKQGELEKIADLLGITPYNIVESACLGQRIHSETADQSEVARVFNRDAWAQPSRARARRK
ncbi:helix-turn-helix transcriptional regulator [Microbacterium sufflavum]|uniref:Helix-turn-helix domain-containing protein n=1 Tax=Microbacterium sufflavum TaxID=2851649 RepID=A0ABY4IBQ0_9MICO|nr:helix-turn-helix transcriptional regulator [Microbacterium sufflavum]UPL09967.1 helix-turn-helix domain-containing protein [Microbacterium sufflavum]